MEKELNQLIADLLVKGTTEMNFEGFSIKASYEDGNLKIEASENNKEEIKVEDAKAEEFKAWVQSLNDDFFLDIVETFKAGELQEIQNLLDNGNADEAINKFMINARQAAQTEIESIDADLEGIYEEIKSLEEDVKQLKECKESYLHVLNKKF